MAWPATAPSSTTSRGRTTSSSAVSQCPQALPKMFGDELMRTFGQVKTIFDPGNLMNPGKVVAPYRLDENLRLGASWSPRDYDSFFSYPDDDGRFGRAVMRCVGVGKCQHDSGQHGLPLRADRPAPAQARLDRVSEGVFPHC